MIFNGISILLPQTFILCYKEINIIYLFIDAVQCFRIKIHYTTSTCWYSNVIDINCIYIVLKNREFFIG